MPLKKNPLNLNALQLKTLTLLQELARSPNHATSLSEGGGVRVANLPRPHGDHFHVGGAVVMAQDANGLENQAVWVALERKGMVGDVKVPWSVTLTEAGSAYDTGDAKGILHRSDH